MLMMCEILDELSAALSNDVCDQVSVEFSQSCHAIFISHTTKDTLLTLVPHCSLEEARCCVVAPPGRHHVHDQ